MPSSSTLRDVANLAGVSLGTASQAINNRPNVSPETRARVLEAAVSLGYQTKEAMPRPCDHHLSVIGMLSKHDVGLANGVNPFYSHVQLGVESECRRRGLSLMFSNIEVDSKNRPTDWPAMLTEQRVDGLILIGTFIEDTIDQIKRRTNIPIVLVDSYAPHFPYDSIITDNIQGTNIAIDHLTDLGHTHIGLVGWKEECPPSIHERWLGFRAALRALNLSLDYIEETPLTRAGGFEGTVRLLRRAPEVTAIFACNDDAAIGVINAARDLGLRVPNDLSVMGFDNIDLAKDVIPALTTVHVHKTWMGTLGVRFLLERAQNSDQPRITTLVSTQLIVRDSTELCPKSLSRVPNGADGSQSTSTGALEYSKEKEVVSRPI